MEIPSFIRANNVALAAMNDELLTLHLAQSVPRSCTGFFFLGRYDRHADALVAEQYLQSLRAPVRRAVWFEHSAHNVPFEEPAAFTEAVVEASASIGVGER